VKDQISVRFNKNSARTLRRDEKIATAMGVGKYNWVSDAGTVTRIFAHDIWAKMLAQLLENGIARDLD